MPTSGFTMAMDDDSFEFTETAENSRPIGLVKWNGKKPKQVQPIELPPEDVIAEEHVIGCCLSPDSDALARCTDAGLPPKAFASPANRLIYEILCEMKSQGMPIHLEVLYQQLRGSHRLEQVGGMAYLVQLTGQYTFQFDHFFKALLQTYWRRKAVNELRAKAEAIANFVGTSEQDFIDLQHEVIGATKSLSEEFATKRKPLTAARGLMDFGFIPPGHPSILLGNRYINRGDALIYASQSGMGKSSLMIQMSMLWSLGMPFFGIRPNGKLRSLIFQAEDSDGDINEVQESIAHELNLLSEQLAEVNKSVRVISERSAVGARFCEQLALHVREFKPDLVFINPLMSYIGGDVSNAEDAAKFLREGLNGVNAKSEFAYIIAHHTSKPPKEKIDRKWSDQQYEMHGSADLTNYARAVMVLESTDTKGEFRLKLAKRGTRAGSTRKSGEANQFEEITTEILLRHATGTVTVQGHVINKIFWEAREATAEEKVERKSSPGRKPRDETIQQFEELIPRPGDKLKSVNQICREVSEQFGMSRSKCMKLLHGAAEDGVLTRKQQAPFGTVFMRK